MKTMKSGRKIAHISEVPANLIRARDRWRYTWRFIPILGWLYRRHYEKLWDNWCKENNVIAIDHQYSII